MKSNRFFTTEFSKLKRNVFGIFLLNLCNALGSVRSAALEMKMTEASVRNYLAALETIHREQLFRIEASKFSITTQGAALIARK